MSCCAINGFPSIHHRATVLDSFEGKPAVALPILSSLSLMTIPDQVSTAKEIETEAAAQNLTVEQLADLSSLVAQKPQPKPMKFRL